MKLYVGGAYQGQYELAVSENPGAPIVADFHLVVRRAIEEGQEARAFARAFIEENPDAVVVTNELGSGIVPMEPSDRAWREAAGRATCLVAQAAETVTRVTCGIGVRIK